MDASAPKIKKALLFTEQLKNNNSFDFEQSESLSSQQLDHSDESSSKSSSDDKTANFDDSSENFEHKIGHIRQLHRSTLRLTGLTPKSQMIQETML